MSAMSARVLSFNSEVDVVPLYSDTHRACNVLLHLDTGDNYKPENLWLTCDMGLLYGEPRKSWES